MSASHGVLMATDTSSKTNGTREPSTYVPYRATKLWNEVVQVFREGLPVGRHRRYMKSYESCFVASEAVTWLHQQLQENSNFGHHVTRVQTVQLLQKFQKARLIVDVRGNKHEKVDFTDNGRLYRFVETSPIKKSKSASRMPTRAPLALRSSLMNSDSALISKQSSKPKSDMERGHSIACLKEEEITKLQAPKTDGLHRKNKRILPKRSQSCREGREVDSNIIKNLQLGEEEIQKVWKDVLVNRLETILELRDIDEVLDPDIINIKDVIHNLTQINKNGLVTNIDKQEQLPHWIISAMRCLAYWPEKIEENLPDYPGFEQDVFKVIREYFWDLDIPLITFQLYEVFLSVMVYADNIGKQTCSQTTPRPCQHSLTIPSTTSVENLLLNMTNQDNIGPDDILIFNDPDVTILPCGLTPHLDTRTLPRCRSNSGMQFSQTRIETSFGVNSDEPETRLYQQKESIRDDFVYQSNHEAESYNAQQQVTNVVSRTNHQRPYSICTTRQALDFDNAHTNSQRCNSLSNVHQMSNGRINSWTSLQSGLQQEDFHCLQDLSHHCRSEHQCNNYNQYGENSQPLSHGNYYPPPPPYSQKPPPYIPPPSYNAVRMRPPPHPLHVRRSGNAQPQPNVGILKIAQNFSPDEGDPSEFSVSQSMPSIPQPKCLLTESYRQAIDSIAPNSTPVGRSLFASSTRQGMQRSTSSPSILTPLSRNRVYEVLQLCCLLIPPANKRKLHLLLRFMNKASNNVELQIDGNNSMKELILNTFTRCILRSEDLTDHDDLMTRQIATFMMEGYVDIMKVPEHLKQEVDEKIARLKRQRITSTWDSDDDNDDEPNHLDDEDNHDVESPFVPYCQQVSVAEFEQQRLMGSQEALSSLLEDLIKNKNISQRDKKRHLKQFQKNHPDIYAKRFPNSQSEVELFPEKPKIKSVRLIKPLQKLRNLRL
ncbi:hypothetical protein LSH36_68g05011 [Paralvinella palmiformis]|uniref:DEP domain-containing protein n=1 Tax=Paralvinella palmiformis TaxID=53620 RepID=A0AAD9K3A0_9ANNE|nr:hypothetical protein LSH36_68g05011 [Paralvinella palmiformis]